MGIQNFSVVTGEVDEAILIMREVAQWCIASKLPMWKVEELTRDKLTNNLKPDNFCIGKINNQAAAAMILQWHDPVFWPDNKENESGYIHKLCVRRDFSGLGLSKEMVDYSILECRKRGINYLRLDTSYKSAKLCEIYERLGFVQVGRKLLNSKDYALYEMILS